MAGKGRRCRNGEGDEKTGEARSSVANRIQKEGGGEQSEIIIFDADDAV